MSTANLASVTFGDVYNDASDDTADEETTQEATRESILGMERLNLTGSENDIPTPTQGGSTTPLPLPTLEGNERKRPLALIELPVDVLKDIVKEVRT
jgi:hypothetical protein